MCVCVCARLERIEAHNYATAWRAIKTIQRAHTHTHVHLYLYLYGAYTYETRLRAT